MPDVLDASAALAWLKSEPGAAVVEPLLKGSLISAVNWSEVLQKARQHGYDPGEVGELFDARGVTVAAATSGDAVLAAKFWEPSSPLSLGDRFCVALAFRMDTRAVTAERSWPDLGTGAEILVIR